jgi:uncharacterized protein
LFVGRQNELGLLCEELSTAKPSLAIKDCTHVFYQATRVTSSLNLESFKAEVAHGLGADDLLTGLGDWLAVLHYLARAAEQKPGLTVVLDELPYLVDADSALPSIIQKFWDSGAARAGNLKLLLCGSMIAQMEELLAERNPLYGRKTLVLDLGPLSFREAAQFVRYGAEDKLLTCSVFGGTPFYLELLHDSETLQSNIIRLLLTQTGSLVDEPVVLLQSELREVSRYASILAAIADGYTKHGEIIGRVKEINDSKALSPYLEKLERMRLVRIVRSMDAAPKERDRRYFIADPLIAFWHRFVRPNLSSVAQGFGRDVWKLQIAPHLDEFMGGAFEEICREHARRFSQESFAAPAQEIGGIWHADFDIDVAGRLLDGSMIYGECKWWKDPVGENILDQLIERASLTSYGRDNPKRQFILYSRAGFTSGLQKRAISQEGIVLHTPHSMLRAAEKRVRKRKRPRTA